MKNKVVKRLVALGLATMASMSMAVSAFAATEGTVTVTIKDYGETLTTKTVDIEDIIEKAGEGKHLYTTEPYAAYATEGIKDPTVADALIEGYSLYKGKTIPAVYDPGYPSKKEEISYNWDLNPYEGKPGIYFIYYNDKTTANESYTPNADGTTTYKGDSWLLSVGDKKSNEYASNIELKDGMKITFDYTTQEFTY